MSALDLVITVDTAAAHLAGALGQPVWVMLGFAADWRYLLHRTDSTWYPSMRLYRQARQGDWMGVAARLADELRDRAAPWRARKCLGAAAGQATIVPPGLLADAGR